MRFLFRMVLSDTDIAYATSVVRGIASSLGGSAVNPKKTSYGALEMDVFVESRQDFDLFLAAVEPVGRVEFYRDLQEAPTFMPTAEALEEAVSLFNSERFWEAHEVLESKWRVAQGDEKLLLQGLILVCASFVHEQKGKDEVALGVAKRALPLLKWDESRYHGIDVASLRLTVADEVAAGKLSIFRINRTRAG
jgi:hypothetical protein